MSNGLVSIVIPVYNESDNIAVCLGRLDKALSGLRHEILICYDRDEDTTLEAISSMEEIPAAVRLVRNRLGQGPAYAMRSGFAAASGDVIVTTMADMCDPPDVISQMVQKVREERADVVSGSRYMRGGSQSGAPLLKGCLSRLAGLSLYWLAGVGTRDATNNFRAYSRRFLASVEVESRYGFELGLELTVKAHNDGFKVTEVPSTWVDREAGESRFRMWPLIPRYLRWYINALCAPMPSISARLWDSPLTGRLRRLQPYLVVALAVLMWLSIMTFPGNPAAVSLGPSWQMAMAKLFRSDMQAGTGFIFPPGPFGWLLNTLYSGPGRHFNVQYDPDVFWLHIFLEGAMCALFVAAFILVLVRLRGVAARVLFALGIMVFLPLFRDALFLSAVVAVSVLTIERFMRFQSLWLRTGSVASVFVLLAFLALVKFTLFAAVTGSVGAIVLAALWRRRFAFAAASGAGYALVFLGVWSAAGQSIATLGAYLSTSLALSSGYNDTMAIIGPQVEVTLALACISVGLLAALACCLEKPLSVVRVISAAIVTGAFFVAWKSGFVRHDLHSVLFFAYASVAPFMLTRPGSSRGIRSAVVTLIIFIQVAMATNGVFVAGRQAGYVPRSFLRAWRMRVADNLRLIMSPRAAKYALDAELNRLSHKHALPGISAAVGSRTVDVVTFDQGLVFLNGLTWHPRPVFQSYSAYTSELTAINARFFKRPDAPEFVIMGLRTIDGRLATTDDPETLMVLVRDYEAVLVEDDYLLLRRACPSLHASAAGNMPARAAAAGPERETVEIQERFNRRIDVPSIEGPCLVMSISIDYTGAGRFIKFLYKVPPMFMTVYTADGQSRRFRIAPDLVKSPFILNPLITDQRSLLGWYTGNDLVEVVSLLISMEPGGLKYFAPTMLLTFEGRDLLPRTAEGFAAHLETMP